MNKLIKWNGLVWATPRSELSFNIRRISLLTIRFTKKHRNQKNASADFPTARFIKSWRKNEMSMWSKIVSVKRYFDDLEVSNRMNGWNVWNFPIRSESGCSASFGCCFFSSIVPHSDEINQIAISKEKIAVCITLGQKRSFIHRANKFWLHFAVVNQNVECESRMMRLLWKISIPFHR